jgi:polyisoprenyl-phosphate glycosyltransferase
MNHFIKTRPEQSVYPELSIVVPMRNEEKNLSLLFTRLSKTLSEIDFSYEIVCINDGSSDNTLESVIDYSRQNPRIKVIDLSRNFGKEIALSAGMDYARGQAVIPIDSDLQDPPELIIELVSKWKEGFDVVYATRLTRHGESWIKRLTAKYFYLLIGKISEVPIPPNTGDFRLLDRKVVEALKQLPERNRFMKGLFSWVGFRQTSIYFNRPPRYKGITNWNYLKLWNYALDGITSFSVLPLKLWTYFGLCISSMALLYATILLVRTIFYGIDVPGYASLMVVTLFLGGVNLIGLGMIGEYLSRVFIEVKGRPLYLVRGTYGFEVDQPTISNTEEHIGNS